jgi:hypothetical protein
MSNELKSMKTSKTYWFIQIIHKQYVQLNTWYLQPQGGWTIDKVHDGCFITPVEALETFRKEINKEDWPKYYPNILSVKLGKIKQVMTDIELTGINK